VIRRLAWEVLRSGEAIPTRRVASIAARHELEGRDRGLLRHLVSTEARRRGTLAALLRHLAHSRFHADLAAHLRLGLVQLFFSDQIPDHAALSETVQAAHDTLGPSKARTVNAVLRAAVELRVEGHCDDPRRDLVGRDLSLAEQVFRDPGEHPLLWAEDALSMPAAFMKPWTRRFGVDGARELARAFLEPSPLSVRCVRGDRAALAAEFEGVVPSAHPAIFLLPAEAAASVIASGAFRRGDLSIQGEAALRAAELCEAREGEAWLDLCAAPGGKAAVLAAAGARVTACDVSVKRIERARETLARLGVADAVEWIALEEGAPPAVGEMDGVLVDAPCSNSGVLGARPDARWRHGPAARTALARLQTDLLCAGAERTAIGGRLVYSTCSIEPEENEQRVRAFLETRPSWRLDEQLATHPRPGEPGGSADGGFAARLLRAD
jgi:16S rRNA (cytosine967-C5)-methyltransferase